jgi:acetylornithine deacetylase
MLTQAFSDELRNRIEQNGAPAIELLQELVRIPSITGDEAKIQDFIANYFRKLKLEIDQWSPTQAELKNHPAFSDDLLPLGARPVVVARWPGVGEGRSLILNGHADVVPSGDESTWQDGPWSGVVRDGKLYGRGSCDMKSGIVAGIFAILALQELGIQLRGDVLFESVIGEETGGVGTLATIIRGYRADGAIVLEPTQLHCCPVGAGAASFRLRIDGLAAHGAMRMEGVSAIEKYFILQNALFELERERQNSFQHPLFSHELVAPISVGKVEAGNWPSTVPESLIAQGRYGILPGENMSEAKKQFEEKIMSAAEQDQWLQKHPPRVEWFEGQFEPAETRLDASVVAVLAESHKRVTGQEIEIHGVPYGSDLRFFTNYAQMPAVLYGPGDVKQAHAGDEFVKIDELLTAANVIAMMMIQWCGV